MLFVRKTIYSQFIYILMGTDYSKDASVPFSIQDLLELRTQVDLDSFETVSVIGRGTYGKVLLVRKRDQGDLFAMKQIRKDIICKFQQYEHIQSERTFTLYLEY